MPAALLGHGRLELDAGALSSRDNPEQRRSCPGRDVCRGKVAFITGAALFLASDEVRYITGVTLPVDAGALLK